MTARFFRFTALFLLLSMPASAQDIVFSRRVYATQGHTYQQLWRWSATDGRLTALTNSSRDHIEPMCSRDGKQIFFRSGARGLDHSIWSFDRTTGAEHELLAASTWNSPRLVGIGADGRLLVERCLASFQASPKPCARIVEWHPADPALDTRGAEVLPLPEHDKIVLSPDGTRLVVNTPPHDKQTYSVSPFGVLMQILNLQTFVTDASAARARTDLPPCDRPVWSPDRSRLACAIGQAITIVDVAARKEVERIRFSEVGSGDAPYPTRPEPEAWSPDGRTLLASMYGENGSSTSPRSDYFLVDLATQSWTRASSGNSGTWLSRRNAIVYITPRDLAPLPPSGAHHVWSAHLAIFDVATRQETLLTSGISNSEQPTLCSP